MENALKSLKNAEERAVEVEKLAADKSAEIVKEAEDSVKKMEVDIEKRSKEAGERHLAAKLDGAKAESARIREKSRAEGEAMERKAKEKISAAVDKVVEAVEERMKSGA